jgi:predicted phosphate transport protein (TIGR00153 family)
VRFRLIPRPEEGFSELFNQVADNMAESARLLRDLFGGLSASEVTQRITACERRGDELTRTILHRLQRTVVPPFDPEDVHSLAEGLDDVIDDIKAASELYVLHAVEDPLPEMLELVDLLVKVADANVALVAKLPKLRDLGPELETIDRLESEADKIYRRSVAHLFSGEFKAFDVLKVKDIVEVVEASVNGIERVSDIIATIAVKHA